MARHRNIRQLDFDDIATYDDALASSVDDDYSISPSTAAMYLRSSGKNDVQPTSLFNNLNGELLRFSSEDFPPNEDVADSSPGHITGRIVSNESSDNTTNPLSFDHFATFEFGDPLMDNTIAPPPSTEVSLFDDSLVNASALDQILSQKLHITPTVCRDRPLIPSASTSSLFSAATTPSKPIDRRPLFAEYTEKQAKSGEKEVVNLIVIGHVDAGKSTLMGNLLCQLGRVSSKQLAKYRWESQKLGKASFAYAWVLDQTSEERSRGVTIDIAQTSFETATKRIALMDAPGHKDFVPRVIGGASQADAALLVVNASNGEFETGFGTGGQTREHARLARLLGVSRIIVAVNKMDTVDWAESRFENIRSQLTSFLKALNLTAVDFCPVSGLTGINLLPAAQVNSPEAAAPSKLTDWYEGPSLLELIDQIPSPDRSIDAPFRFVVSDIFKPTGLGVPAVAGRILSGAVSAGLNLATSRVLCQPSGLCASVKSMRSLCALRDNRDSVDGGDSGVGILDQSVKSAFAGDQVALILNGIDPFQSLAPGDVITDPDNPVPLASRIGAKLLVFSIKQPITRGYPVIFYYHSTSVSANISRLKSMTHRENKMEKTVKKPRCLPGSCTADVEISLDRPVCLEIYDKCKPLGRFMLRVAGESVAGGTITSVLPSKKNRLIDG